MTVPLLETPRLVLRPPRLEDLDGWAALAADAEQFGPFAPYTPAALPAPALPHGRLRSRGRVGLLKD